MARPVRRISNRRSRDAHDHVVVRVRVRGTVTVPTGERMGAAHLDDARAEREREKHLSGGYVPCSR